MKNEPVLIIMSVLAALQALVASADWIDVVPEPVAKITALVVAAATVGMAYYVRGHVTPLDANRSGGKSE